MQRPLQKKSRKYDDDNDDDNGDDSDVDDNDDDDDDDADDDYDVLSGDEFGEGRLLAASLISLIGSNIRSNVKDI